MTCGSRDYIRTRARANSAARPATTAPVSFHDTTTQVVDMASKKAPTGHFSILYFAAASTFTGKTSEHLPAPIKACDLFDTLEDRYPGIKGKVLASCAVTVDLEYIDINEGDAADLERVIQEGDEVAIIPPVSSG
ncbi:hypothetical protein HBI56_006790 [Parastagonospora nodorum]|nr:hypothetical protein SNOG_00596 [Parastagonospora nodorum SN15]KAH3912197.1 hypothetical protein HBH56_122960 [Parastagonospora nodorum]EAT92091.1 hypothetical protein SNOG_00596 [Parastagonospora nodorum SN15]KAH3935281.1 hypothetical protein HBH54_048500 [Parastagonospora nodorum]KAH3949986.1 hypothetical protein HBH53_075490 [Parastagonospora nodorum]KAH4005683.1 hypothetical protein HBI10_031890 [Parastagonospora nodorum]